MISKLVANAAAALADVPDGATVMIGGFGTARPADGADRRAARTGPRHHQQQRRQRHRRPGRAAGREPRAQDHLLVPGRWTRRSSTACTAAARSSWSWCRSTWPTSAGAGIGAFFTPTGYGTPLAEGRNPRNQRPPVRAGIPAARRLRADQGRARRPLGQPGVPQDRAQLRPHHGQRGARGRGAGARDRRTGRARSENVVTPASSCNAWCGSTPPGRQGTAMSQNKLSRDEIAARVARDIPRAPT